MQPQPHSHPTNQYHHAAAATSYNPANNHPCRSDQFNAYNGVGARRWPSSVSINQSLSHPQSLTMLCHNFLLVIRSMLGHDHESLLRLVHEQQSSQVTILKAVLARASTNGGLPPSSSSIWPWSCCCCRTIQHISNQDGGEINDWRRRIAVQCSALHCIVSATKPIKSAWIWRRHAVMRRDEREWSTTCAFCCTHYTFRAHRSNEFLTSLDTGCTVKAPINRDDAQPAVAYACMSMRSIGCSTGWWSG